MDHFLVLVSNRRNLELCVEHALAGFPNSIPGAWAFLIFDIQVERG